MSDQVKKGAGRDERLARLTNLELWQGLIGWTPESQFRQEEIELELEWRLRKLGFLPALPLEGA